VFTTRTHITTEGGRETIEIISSDDERMSDEDALGSADEDALGSGDKVANTPLIPVPTYWLDPNIVSRVAEEHIKITTQFSADRVEYLSELPLVWPIFRQPTAVVLDLSDPKFNIVDKKGKRLCVDTLIRDNVSIPLLQCHTLIATPFQDQDSWSGGSGIGDSSSMVYNVFGDQPVVCRRVRLHCRGSYACSQIDPTLLDVIRYELDEGSRDEAFEAETANRAQEGSTPDLQVAA
jgi:hypothetical protein